MFDAFLSVLFPERCRGCKKSGTALCTACFGSIRHAPPTEIPHTCALFDYGEPLVQKAVWELKYHRKSMLAKALAENGAAQIPEYLAEILQGDKRKVVFVPIAQHRIKTRDRGFNQSYTIAKWFSQKNPDIPVQPILRKTRPTLPQAHSHSKHIRAKNVKHSMLSSVPLDAQTLYIIVDDVITTGSTVQEASRALRAAGARCICSIALAHGYRYR